MVEDPHRMQKTHRQKWGGHGMTRLLFLAVLVMAAAFGAGAGAVDYASKDIVARTEVAPIPSMTLSDTQFLQGQAGTPVTIAGVLRIPQGTTARFPLVIILHGSGGMSASYDIWQRELNEIGIATFAVDSFTARGLTNVNADQAALGRLNETLDAYNALAVLAKHPRIDPTRIALLGFSRGGQGTLYAGVSRFHQLWNKSGADFATYVAFYPNCGTTYVDDAKRSPKPTVVLHGTADDYNPIAPCKSYAARVKDAGGDLQIIEYANAHHAFDNPLGNRTPTPVANGQTDRNCSIEERTNGALINKSTGVAFTYKDTCVQLNPNTAFHAEASPQAHKAVADHLKKIFAL
jgi:dienelactone hydrolase